MGQGYKKMAAVLLATLMAVNGSSGIYAASSDVTNGTMSGVGRMEGDALSEDVFSVELPVVPGGGSVGSVSENVSTPTPYDFILDPNKLLGEKYPDKKIEKNATLYFTNQEQGASYDYSHISDAMTIRNKSTMDVDVELDTSIGNIDTSGIKLTRDSEFTNDTSSSIYMALTDSMDRVSVVDRYGSFRKTVLKGRPKAYKTIYDTTTQQYKYVLKNNAELKADGITFPNYTFRLTGACNPKNSWSKIKDDLQLTITTTWKVSVRPKEMAPSIGKTFYSMTKDKGIVMDIELGTGSLAAKGIKSVAAITQTGTETLSDDDYRVVDGTLRFTGTYISKLIQTGVTAQELTITFDDKAETQVNITFTNENTAPFIEDNFYNMVKDEDIQINVDLGSGDLAATGIKSISFIKNGETATVSDADHIFKDGKLTLKGSYITRLIKAGISSREYTITFDNTTGTQVKFTLSVDGSAPSIGQTSCVMVKDTDVELSVYMGSDYLEAKGIKSIQVVKDTGLSTFPTENYTYADGKLTIKGACITNLINAGVISREYIVVFDNVAETQVKITLIAEEKAPSIGKDVYTMEMGKAIPIDIDLGSGSLRANGIKLITVTKDTGEEVFPENNYTYADGKLSISAECITRLIKAGVTNREYTITFNDKNATKVKFTLQTEGVAPFITNTSHTMYKDTDVVMDVNLGSGYLAAQGIKMITTMKSTGLVTFSTSNYTFADGKLTIKSACINNLIKSGVTTREYIVTFDNKAETKVSITLTAEEKSPSIGTSRYAMEVGKDIPIDIDLGSGSLMASGIKSLKVIKDTGATDFSTNNYTFADGKLKINGACITNLIKGGIRSRDYAIIFNDKNTTEVRFTLYIDGTVPSIRTTSYEIVKGRNVTINVDLGTGGLAATGIKSIQVVKDSGNTTFATTNYTYANSVLTIKDSCINNLINGGVISRVYSVIFDNAAETKVNITLTAKDVAPSIEGRTFTMTTGRSIPITVDLGAGRLKASGIQSITTVKSGVTSTFASSNYTFAGGTLTISSTCVNNLLKAGIASRDYTITFNDASKTKVTFTLKK
jgi:Domain of unknown function.